MGYSIGQVAKKTGLTAHTLRYYEKEGLLPFVRKNGSGLRVFSDSDLGWLTLIECLKGTGMPLKGIKQYIDWYMAGDSTLPQRLEMFKEQKSRLLEQMAQLQKHMEKIDYKIAYYEEIIARGEQGIWERCPELKAERDRIYGKMVEEKEQKSA
ncbi:MAG: MerR family transcriptional regulator [Alphaproteobacteria bacterium]|nr:MerR family transcriptional regulator [Alphaproteobacteria bacterium]MBQ8631376.1 MerR family transcriptional regulator [Alphaproteobacteria bacterium]